MAVPPHQEGFVPGQDERYPLKETAEFLDRKLGLYLSAEQKRGFATGLLVGTAFAGALLAWSIGGMIKKTG